MHLPKPIGSWFLASGAIYISVQEKTLELLEKSIECPYCGENLDVLIDHTEAGQSYIEDCQVCCRPINFSLVADLDGNIEISVRSDNE